MERKMIYKKYSRRRSAFTIVELLVATALTMLIMAIMATAFQSAMGSLSHLRSTGELQERLRVVATTLKADLQSPHFDDPNIKNGMLSNLRHDLPQTVSYTPAAGFVKIDQQLPSLTEAIASGTRDYSTTANLVRNHRLTFTVKLQGTSRETLFTAPKGAGVFDNKNDNFVKDSSVYGSRWAVVQWFLTPMNPPSTTIGASPQPLYNLHRKVMLLAEVDGVTSSNASSFYVDSSVPAPYPVYTAARAAIQPRPAPSVVPLTLPVIPVADDGSDIVLSNILSFEVKADYSPVTLVTGAMPRFPAAGNYDYPFDDLPGVGPNIYDSSYHGMINAAGLIPGQNMNIRAIQVKVRIYDAKNKTSRQVTLVHEM
jgi:type II secretory pathway pseudopilin PulG